MSPELLIHSDADVDFWASDEEDVRGAPSPHDGAPLDALPSSASDADDEQRALFETLADELATATRGLSSTRRAARHPAYAEILALGEQAIPWLLNRLECPGDRPLWLRLLGALTHYQPGAGRETIPEAAEAWMGWGRLHNAR